MAAKHAVRRRSGVRRICIAWGILSQPPRLTGVAGVAYTNDLDAIHFTDNCACSDLPFSDRSGTVAERKSGGFGGSFWRHGLADGIRPAWLGDVAFQGDHGIGDFVYDHILVAFDHGDTAVGRCDQHDPGKSSGSGGSEAGGRHDNAAGSGSGRPCSGDAGLRSGSAGPTFGDANRSGHWRDEDDADYDTAATGPWAIAGACEEVVVT